MYFDYALEQERTEANSAAQCEAEQAGIQAAQNLGATDAACGRLPQFANNPYLEGYLAKLKELPTDDDGCIIHHSPSKYFSWGYVDTPRARPCLQRIQTFRPPCWFPNKEASFLFAVALHS
ncbi:MAG: hypothetical protein AAF609_16645 [Cyanobacteria bacterium P01_C01_bin.120]